MIELSGPATGLEWLGPLGGIILVDLVLSGDNALVIGAAAAGLRKQQRWWAILLGGGGAVILRIVFTILATFLLRMPLLQAIGAAILLYIAVRLLIDRSREQAYTMSASQQEDQPRKGFMAALLTILVADVTMSLDNVLAVGALASGHLTLLIIGLVLSIGLLLVGSALVASLIELLPWLLDVASLVLAWTAAHMLLEDLRLKPIFDNHGWTQIAIPAFCLAIIILADIYLLWRHSKQK